MNLSYYILVFDLGAEVILSKFKMGEQSAKTTKKSTMVVETHTTYNNEVKEGDEVEVFLSHFDHDNKRLHYKLEMYDKNKNVLSATTEVLSLYIDLSIRKVTELEEEKKAIIDEFINQNKSNFKSDNLKFSNKLKK
ncbi:MAG: thioesterase family protein [Pelagibacterales bacterium]|nr:thioesterase family protein [Pelagibacterales bacterium]